MQLNIEHPYFLWALLPVMALGAAMLRQRRRHPLSFSWRRFALVMLAFIFGVLALARPQLGRRVISSASRGSNIFFAIDISRSMLAQDTTPSRLAFGVSFAQKLLGQLAGVKVAIFPFAGDGYVQVPLTTDLFAAADMMTLLSPGQTTQQGTDLTRSLTTLLTQIDRMEQAAREKGTDWLPTRVLLISDGESHQSLRAEVLAQYRSRKIPIFTVGTGSTAGTYIPAETRFGMRDRLRDNDGRQVLTKLYPDVLRKVAAGTGGEYFNGRFEEVFRVRDRLSQSVSMGRLSTSFKMEQEYFPLLLTVALIIFLMEFGFGRWEYAIRSLPWLLLVPALAVAEPMGGETPSRDPAPTAVESYNNGVKEAETNPTRAAELFQESATLSDDPEVRKKALFNLGNALLKIGDPVQALQAYQQAYDTKAPGKKFDLEANQKISENIVLAAKVLEEVRKQMQEQEGQGDPKQDKDGNQGKNEDPKGPKKQYQAQMFNESQKKKIFDLLASDEQQTMQRVQEGRNRNKPQTITEKPW